MKPIFITVTGEKKVKISINANLISAVYRDYGYSKTSIVISKQLGYSVEELPEDVLKMIEEASK